MSSELQVSYQEFDGQYPGYIRTSHDGFAGETVIKSFVISSISDEHYYNNIELLIDNVAGETIEDGNLFHSKGWTIKLIESPVEPTEKEWSYALPNTKISLSSIGSETAANTNTRIIVWVRIHCPGHTEPDILNSLIKLKYNTMLVTQGDA